MGINNKELERKKAAEIKDFLNESGDISELENVLISLDESFSIVAAFEDSVQQEYELIKEAKRLDIPVESYRRMFETYQSNSSAKTFNSPLLKPIKFFDQRLGDIVKWCENLSIYSLATVIGQFTLLAAMGAYFLEGPQRQQQAISAARAEIRAQNDVEYSQSRIDAIQSLNQMCESLLGEQLAKANLEGIEINKCYKFDLGQVSLAQWPPQLFKYEGFNLSQSNLAGANLKGANLAGINLEGSNLEGVNLAGANLKGANLKGANLKGANLRMANLEGANLESANLDGSFMSRINLQDANLTRASIVHSGMLWSNLAGAKLIQTNLQNSNLSRANLQGAILYKAKLDGALLRYADLRNGTIMIGADLEGADLKRAKFWSADQLRRAYNWEKAIKDQNWEAKIANSGIDSYKIGFLLPNDASFHKLYQQGIEKFAKEHQNVEVIPLKVADNPQGEAEGIRQLLAQDVDAIVLRPRDPQKSTTAILTAYIAGVVPITIGDCLSSEAKNVVFACYESDSYKMGYDISQYMGNWAKKELPGQAVNIGFVDGADSTRLFPYLQGFLAGIKNTGIRWNYTASTNATTAEEVKTMLRDNPNINVLWGANELRTRLAIQAVKELGLSQKVKVFGIVPLTRDFANQLLNPKEPLQSIVDESHSAEGYQAAAHAIAVIEGKVSRVYQYQSFPYRLFTQSDQKPVKQLLDTTLDLDRNNLKPPLLLKDLPPQIPSQILSSLDFTKALILPAITDKETLVQLQKQLQTEISQTWQTLINSKANSTVTNLTDDLVYRVLVNKNGIVMSYEPLNEVSRSLAATTPLAKLLPEQTNNQPNNTDVQPVAELKVVFSPKGTVEVKWGQTFVPE
ncbi:pentapeptide repeat-containing protein [Aerosakkonemataceae cyanobacterium BLCC-F50]|uniref:Pentapeptide repeat-containing protein n=1 Tax=Floridaenema flaviceps BLCC-F50 TaxID=3153642 RepID=A0ABV4XWY9_9CYAN